MMIDADAAPVGRYYCTVADRSIEVVANAPEVRERLYREFLPFYRIDDQPGVTGLLGTVVAQRCEFPDDLDRTRGQHVLLHDGTYATAKRRGLEQLFDGKCRIWCYDSGSLFELDDYRRIAVVTDPSGKNLSLDCRRVVRNQTIVSWLESQGGVSCHAASFYHYGQGYMV